MCVNEGECMCVSESVCVCVCVCVEVCVCVCASPRACVRTILCVVGAVGANNVRKWVGRCI